MHSRFPEESLVYTTVCLHHAQTEDELASVLAHEIAHISQRHFSRRQEQARNQSPLTVAGLIAGLVLAATAGSDAGLAAMTATQAAAQDSMLRYSRANEAEADRIGSQHLDCGRTRPHAAADMHERMLAAYALHNQSITRISPNPPDLRKAHRRYA